MCGRCTRVHTRVMCNSTVLGHEAKDVKMFPGTRRTVYSTQRPRACDPRFCRKGERLREEGHPGRARGVAGWWAEGPTRWASAWRHRCCRKAPGQVAMVRDAWESCREQRPGHSPRRTASLPRVTLEQALALSDTRSPRQSAGGAD